MSEFYQKGYHDAAAQMEFRPPETAKEARQYEEGWTAAQDELENDFDADEDELDDADFGDEDDDDILDEFDEDEDDEFDDDSICGESDE